MYKYYSIAITFCAFVGSNCSDLILMRGMEKVTA